MSGIEAAISFGVFQWCERLGCDFVSRVAQNRNILVEGEEEQEDQIAEHLKTLARSWVSQGVKVLTVLAERGRGDTGSLGQPQLVAGHHSTPPLTERR